MSHGVHLGSILVGGQMLIRTFWKWPSNVKTHFLLIVGSNWTKKSITANSYDAWFSGYRTICERLMYFSKMCVWNNKLRQWTRCLIIFGTSPNKLSVDIDLHTCIKISLAARVGVICSENKQRTLPFRICSVKLTLQWTSTGFEFYFLMYNNMEYLNMLK